jgi:hypothetical protein
MKADDTPALLPYGRMYARPGFGNKLKITSKTLLPEDYRLGELRIFHVRLFYHHKQYSTHGGDFYVTLMPRLTISVSRLSELE